MVARFIIGTILIASLLVLVGMSFLRVNNLDYDVKVLKEKVARLEESAGRAPAAAPPSDNAPAAPPQSPETGTHAPSAPWGGTATVEAVTPAFLDDATPEQVVSLAAAGASQSPIRHADVAILAVEGSGLGEKALVKPITFTLAPGSAQSVAGICQGPETAAWIFSLESNALRVTSRECQYPVRGLRPRVRVTVTR